MDYDTQPFCSMIRPKTTVDFVGDNNRNPVNTTLYERSTYPMKLCVPLFLHSASVRNVGCSGCPSWRRIVVQQGMRSSGWEAKRMGVVGGVRKSWCAPVCKAQPATPARCGCNAPRAKRAIVVCGIASTKMSSLPIRHGWRHKKPKQSTGCGDRRPQSYWQA